MPGFVVTRGLGPSATPSAFIAQGFVFQVAVEAIRIIRGGRSEASRAIKDLTETFKISAMLVNTNGKELINPILSKVSKTFSEISNLRVRLLPKKLIARKSNDIKVIIGEVKKRKNNESN